MFWFSLYLVGMLWSYSVVKSMRASGVKAPIWIETGSVVLFPVFALGMLLGKTVFMVHKALK